MKMHSLRVCFPRTTHSLAFVNLSKIFLSIRRIEFLFPAFLPSIYSLAIPNNLHTYAYTHPVNLIQFNRIDRSKYSTVNSCKKCSNRSFPFKRFSKVREGKQFAEHGEWRGEMCNGSTLPVGSFQDV